MSKSGQFTGAKLFKVPPKGPSPRQPGSLGDKSWRVIKNGMTYEAYLRAGGRRNDLAWCVEHGVVKLEGGRAQRVAKVIAKIKKPGKVSNPPAGLRGRTTPSKKIAKAVGFFPVPKPSAKKKPKKGAPQPHTNKPATITGMPKKDKVPLPPSTPLPGGSPLDDLETEDMPL